MNITKAQESKLVKIISHITGECMCKPSSSSCFYWKHIDKGGDDWQTKAIIKEIKKL